LATEYQRHGMSAGQARAAARRTFGGVDQMKEMVEGRDFSVQDDEGAPATAVISRSVADKTFRA